MFYSYNRLYTTTEYTRGRAVQRTRKRAQTTHFASFGPFVCFFIFILCFISTNNCIQVLLIHGKADTTKTGPNDAKRVVWAIHRFFILCFIFTNNCIQVLLIYGKADTTKTGPNDTFCVVWAIRNFFSFLSCLLLLKTVLGSIYLREGRDHEKGPKRRQTRRLGHL